jgi:hypothetical protein
MYFNFLSEVASEIKALGYTVIPHPVEDDEIQVIDVKDGDKFLADCYEHDLLSYETDDSHYYED